MEEIMKRAQADLKQTQTAIYKLRYHFTKNIFTTQFGNTRDKHKVTAAVLDRLAEQHPDDATVVGYAKDVVGEATDSSGRTISLPSRYAAGRDRNAEFNAAWPLRIAILPVPR